MSGPQSKIQVKCVCGAMLAVSVARAGSKATCPNCARQVDVSPAAEYLDVVNFLVEGGVYIDALRVSKAPQ